MPLLFILRLKYSSFCFYYLLIKTTKNYQWVQLFDVNWAMYGPIELNIHQLISNSNSSQSTTTDSLAVT